MGDGRSYEMEGERPQAISLDALDEAAEKGRAVS